MTRRYPWMPGAHALIECRVDTCHSRMKLIIGVTHLPPPTASIVQGAQQQHCYRCADPSAARLCRTLGALAEKCHAFAKALHYKELEFQDSPGTAVEALISINNQLRQPEAAIGVLTVAQQTLNVDLKVRMQGRPPR